MADTSDIRNGLCIKFNHDIYSIVEFQHVKPGKGNAFVRTRLKSMRTGRILDNTFPAGSKLDVVRVERRQYQYLYPEGEYLVFMHVETFEQVPVLTASIESNDFLKEGDICEMVVDTETEEFLTVEIPTFVICKVTYTEPGIKGDTATNTMKYATLETGAEIKVPLFVDNDELIKVDTRTRSYVERVKQ